MTMRPNSIVHSVIYDETKGKAVGVRVLDSETKEEIEFFAPVIFLNASTLGSTFILLNSTSGRFPNGLGNGSDQLGRNLMDHHYRAGAEAEVDGYEDKYYSGRRPNGIYIPRFRNIHKQEMNFQRGYAIGIGGGRGASPDTAMIGDQLRENLLNPPLGNWHISSWMMGETVPVEKNHVRLHPELKDKYGIPQLIASCEWTENDDKMVEDYVQQSKEMFEKAGFTKISAVDTKTPPGSDIHEMGGVRMGLDPKTSLLNGWNQLHLCKNVIVTDGACMTSTGTQNPTLTFMALTARAANHAVEEMKKKNL